MGREVKPSEPVLDRPAGRSLSCPPDRPGSLESSAPPLLPLSRPRPPLHRPRRRSRRSAPPRPRRPRLEEETQREVRPSELKTEPPWFTGGS